jgi:predicted ATPase/class 3 adenylate cyclase
MGQTADDVDATTLPSGLITFVFTDIQASTRLYKALGENAAGDVFDRHNEILRDVWTTHNGHEVHTEGDSFFVVFADADDAVAACAAVQSRIGSEPWPEDGAVQVRIGIHAGLAAPRNNDYMALAVHQAARVMAAANGQQVLLTDAVLQQLDSPTGSIVRLGAFRLRDFEEAPVLHRLEAEGMPSNDQPPRATPANRHNLVNQLTSFVGRSADIVTVNGLLAPGRIVTVAALGGMGKTRLATEVGFEVVDAWEAGVWMIELAEITDANLIADTVGAAIGVAASGPTDRWHDVLTHIGDSAMLLIFDNVEHLVDECSELIVDLLRACPNVAVLCTSREPLNCPGEAVYRLNPLDTAADTANPFTMPAVELFVDRARSSAVALDWTDEAIVDVVAICQRVDGLPLAIEVAAAQTAVLQLGEILAGLTERFRLLRSRDRALPARHRTMEGLLDWSYALLTEDEQRALRRLAVFRGTFSIEGAEAALAADDLRGDDVPELIWTLVDKSLIAADLTEAATRYKLFESVQHYAMRLLVEDGDALRTAQRLAAWLLQQIAPWQNADRDWLGTIALEIANVRSVVDLIAAEDPETAQQLMCSVARHHDSVQSYHSGIDEIAQAVATISAETPSFVALQVALSELHLRAGDVAAASTQLDLAESVQDRVGAPTWDDIAIARNRGEIANRTGDFDRAIEIADRALSQEISVAGAARMWSLAGIAHATSGRTEQGLLALENSLANYIELNDVPRINAGHGNIAEAAWRQGALPTAAKHQAACLEGALVVGQQVLIAYSLVMAARLASITEDHATAVRLQQLAEQVLDDAGHQPYEDEIEAFSRIEAAARDELGSDAVQALASTPLSIVEGASAAHSVFDQHKDSTARRG